MQCQQWAYFTSSTTNGLTDVVEVDVNQIANIKSKIATRLGVSDVSNITLETIEQNGELETCSEIKPDSAYQTYSILAVVSGTGITTRYYRYTINLYGYTGTSLEITEYYTNADMAYSLSNLHDEIAEKISDTISDSTAKTFWTFTDGDNTLTAITTEDLSETPTNTYTYYVRLGINKYSVSSGKEYFSDPNCEEVNKEGELAEEKIVTKAGDNYKITIESTEYYVKPSDVISEEIIRYYKLVVTYTKTSA